jgi:hypothetical protein
MSSLFSGKKTYLVAIGLIVYEVLGYALGKSATLDMKTILEAIGLATLRAGVSKV